MALLTPPIHLRVFLALFLGGLIACSPRADDPAPSAGPVLEHDSEGRTFQRHDDLGILGHWSKVPERQTTGLTAEQQAAIARLNTIGYLSGTEAPGGAAGLAVYDPDRAFHGLNLYYAGHAAAAYLMDMTGTVLHTWALPVEAAWPEAEVFQNRETYWRKCHLYPNGDLLVMYVGRGLARIDRHSNLIWKTDLDVHHDLEVLPDGAIWTLTREAHLLPQFNATEPVLEDFIVALDSGGNVLRQVSVLEAVQNSPFAHLIERGQKSGDLFHTNTIRVLDGRIADRVPAFRAGNVLTSLCFNSALAVIDMETGQVVWAHTGDYRNQHDPKILENGNLLLFDNAYVPEEDAAAPRCSRVLEYDPATMEPIWIYACSEDAPFYTAVCGLSDRLPNGNTLITSSCSGRAFEVTPEKDIVWEYFIPHRAGDGGEYIATLFECKRLPADAADAWLPAINN